MPNRILKESICTSDKISQCSWFEEVLFYRLIVNCDDFGRFDRRTAVIKSRLFPLADSLTLKNVDDAVKKLVSIGLVSCYEANGKPFLFLPTWNEHQNIRAKKSKYPEPENICKQMISDDCKCPRNPIRIQSESESESNPKPETRTRATAAAVYLDRVNASASQTCLEQLAAYEREMGAEVCIRAMDIALDSSKATWPYIRGILSKWQTLGVRCLADIDLLNRKKAATAPPAAGSGAYYKPAGMESSLKKDIEWLEKFTEGEK